MIYSILSATTLVSLATTVLGANFSLVQDFSGNGFFDAWDFYGQYDNLTNGGSSHFTVIIDPTLKCLSYTGDVTYVNQTNATNLAYINPIGHAIIKVDNTTFVPYNDKRNSVRNT
jgi:hypothetical protein